MTGPINPEMQMRAVGVVQGLRARASFIERLAPLLPEDLARDYRSLVSRALAVTGETTWGEIAGIFDSFLEMSMKWNLLKPENGRIN